MKKIFGIAVICLTLFSCKKEKGNENPSANPRNIKYEISGNYSGKLTVTYHDNVNGYTVVNNVSLPWSKEITYPPSVTDVSIGAESSTAGIVGETVTIKLYSGGEIGTRSITGNAGATGKIGVLGVDFILF